MTEPTAAYLSRAKNVSLLALAGLVLVPGGTFLGILPPFVGFQLFMLAILVAIGTAAYVGIRPRVGRFKNQTRPSFRVAGIPLLIGVVALSIPLLQRLSSSSTPIINDITTDLAEPPAFRAALKLDVNQGRDMSYPPDFAELQRGAYSDLKSLQLGASPATVFSEVEKLCIELGWEITGVDREELRIEGTETTRIFRFVDDVVIRVRPLRDGTKIDVRSKSRAGKGDMGVNAARIRRFFDAMSRRLPK